MYIICFTLVLLSSVSLPFRTRLANVLPPLQPDQSPISPPCHTAPTSNHPISSLPNRFSSKEKKRKGAYKPPLPHNSSKSLPSLQNSPSSPSRFKTSTALSTYAPGPPAPAVFSTNSRLARCTSAAQTSQLQVGEAKRYKLSSLAAAVVGC
jgi:hypothetical protein